MRRLDMDAALLRVAEEAGARVLQGVRVVGVTVRDGRASEVVGIEASKGTRLSVPADTVIGADGSTSRVRTCLLGRPPPETTGLAMRCFVGGYPSSAWLDFVLPLEHAAVGFRGYGWAFPLGDGTANVGVGVFASAAVNRFPRMSRLLDDLLERLGTLRGFSSLTPVGRPRSGLLRSWEHVPRGPRNVLLVGDAAGLVNPVTGEGIAAALESGCIAGGLGFDGRGGDLAAHYAASVIHLQAEPFRLLKSVPWQFIDTMLGTSRAGLTAIRQAAGDAVSGRVRAPPPKDSIDESVNAALDSAPALLRRAASDLRGDRGDPVASLFRAVLDSVVESSDRDMAALISLLDVQAALAQDVRRDSGEDVADTSSLMLADLVSAHALDIGGRAGRRLCADYAARLAGAGIDFEFSPGTARARRLFGMSALSGEFAGRHLAGRGVAGATPEDILVSECMAVAALHDLAWRSDQLRLWRERGTHPRDLPSWAGDGVASARELLLAAHTHVPCVGRNVPSALRSLRAAAETRFRRATGSGPKPHLA